ncbi:DUF3300 domain-containing protein (plasmid) [Caballeronia sp. NK8]|uniref:DUF3300 domain-containing protein n=1 Tax=Caballeronia sp. NK8 TaxID=140098 RepID=UPI001BB635E8|nr:DUF3300 domain-containing protein [Caballeronia sp. NK8]BCQ28525.1 DUF3300 domain-containing protein [Caballeronia sp. NK8]
MTTRYGRLLSASLVVLMAGCPSKQQDQPAQTQAASAPAQASAAPPASVAAPVSAAVPASVAAVPPLPASATQPAAQQYPPEELEALVAPIALYPDSLLSQVLMASTYPLEIVHAARWVRSNPNVKGDAAVKAVQDQTWDVSVKSLVAFPQVLVPMNDKLDWTQRLGDAFLAQPNDVLAAVQRLRIRAQDTGHLKSTPQQKVSVEARSATSQSGQPGQAPPTQIVRIEPANPQVIYVPSYNPTVVYGAWPAPAYPPTYWPPPPAYYPGAALASGFAWGLGIAAAGAIFSDCNWNNNDVNVNINKATNIDRNFDRTKVEGGKWQHDARHRQGVSYRDNATRDKYSRGVQGADARRDYRGRNGATPERVGAANRPATRDQAANRPARANNANVANRADAANRAHAQNRQAGAGNRAQTADRKAPAANRPQTANRPAHTSERAQSHARGGAAGAQAGNRGAYGGGARDTAFQGVGGGGGAAQRDFNRGQSSFQSSNFHRGGGGGGARGGGGGGGARHGGRR